MLENKILNSLAKHDIGTYQHSVRVAGLVEKFSDVLKVKSELKGELKTSALLHDVGKILVPREILNSRNSLSCNEREIINKHPYIGYKITKDFGPQVSDMVATHHDIKNGSFLLMFADIYDALRSPRSYKEPWSISSIYRELVNIFPEKDKELLKTLLFEANKNNN